MMLTEKHHAFIAMTFYRELTQRFPETGKQAFILATQRYAEQRGSRMAQRVIRDGKCLDFKNYIKYREWYSTKGNEHRIETVSLTPDYHYKAYSCPWQAQFLAMGEQEGACTYCTHLDLAIARGYNPYLVFKVNKLLHTDECCEFILEAANIIEVDDLETDKGNTLPFEYHCAHIIWTFSAIVRSIYGKAGECAAEAVRASFSDEFGGHMLESLMKYEHVDFNVLPLNEQFG